LRERLNLASRPFRNEALPNLGFVLVSVVALAVTVQHALWLRGLVGEASSALHGQVAALEAELSSLRREAQSVRVEVPESGKLTEWRAVKELVDRRSFSWTLLLSRLESVLPPGIRLEAITPSPSGGQVRLDLHALARSRDLGYDFAAALQKQGSFAAVLPQAVESTTKGERFSYTMVYRPPEAHP
jgi:Tfp pilus assembly protein PilN